MELPWSKPKQDACEKRLQRAKEKLQRAVTIRDGALKKLQKHIESNGGSVTETTGEGKDGTTQAD